MRDENFPIINTKFLRPDVTDSDIKDVLENFKDSEEVVLKRGISGAMKNVSILQREHPQIIKKMMSIIKKNNFNGAYWLVQPKIPELQSGEMKLFFINGKFSFGFHINHPTIEHGSIFDIREIRSDAPIWNELDIPEAIQLGEKVYLALRNKAPSLAVIFRLDVFRNRNKKLIINELEYFGNMWFMMQHCTVGESRLEDMANALKEYLQI